MLKSKKTALKRLALLAVALAAARTRKLPPAVRPALTEGVKQEVLTEVRFVPLVGGALPEDDLRPQRTVQGA